MHKGQNAALAKARKKPSMPSAHPTAPLQSTSTLPSKSLPSNLSPTPRNIHTKQHKRPQHRLLHKHIATFSTFVSLQSSQPSYTSSPLEPNVCDGGLGIEPTSNVLPSFSPQSPLTHLPRNPSSQLRRPLTSQLRHMHSHLHHHLKTPHLNPRLHSPSISPTSIPSTHHPPPLHKLPKSHSFKSSTPLLNPVPTSTPTSTTDPTPSTTPDQTLSDPVLTSGVEAHLTGLFENIIAHNYDHIAQLINHYQPTPSSDSSALPTSSSSHHTQNSSHNDPSTRKRDQPSEHNSTPSPTTAPLSDILTTTLKSHASSYIFDFASFYSHVYPIQHKPITAHTPIVVLSTVSIQHYLQQTFDLISQYKAFLADPRSNPLPVTMESFTTTVDPSSSSPGIPLHQTIQAGTPRSLAVATFMNYPVVTLENLGLSVEALAYACGFSHEHIPTPYKCLAPLLKIKFQDKEGLDIRTALKKGLPSKSAGTTGKATKSDLERWNMEVQEHVIEYERQKHLKTTQMHRDEIIQQSRQAKFTGQVNPNSPAIKNYGFAGDSGDSYDGGDEQQNDFAKHGETDPLEQEARLLRSVEDLEHKSFEKLIHSMISQRLHELGVKAVVVVDDVVNHHNSDFFLHLQEYMNKTMAVTQNSVEAEEFAEANARQTETGDITSGSKSSKLQVHEDSEDPYAFSGDFKSAYTEKGLQQDTNRSTPPLHAKSLQTLPPLESQNTHPDTLANSNANPISHFTQQQFRLALKALYQHYLTIFSPIVQERERDGLTSVRLGTDEKMDFNPQFVQSFFEWVVGFGLNPAHFHQHTQHVAPFLTDVLKRSGTDKKNPHGELNDEAAPTSTLVSTTPLITGETVPTQIHADLSNYIQTTVDLLKGLHLGDIDATLYNDVLSSSKSGGIYSLLLKSNILSKKQKRKRRHDVHTAVARKRQEKNRQLLKRKLGGDDVDGWNSDGDSESGSDDDDDDSDEQSDSDAGKTDGTEYDDSQIDELTGYLVRMDANAAADSATDGTDQNQVAAEDLVLHRDPTHRLAATKAHINLNQARTLRNTILAKENVIFGPLVGVDFVNGIARTKRLRGSFDQRSPLIQAVLGARNAVKATPNARNPLMAVNEAYAKRRYEDEQKELLLTLQQDQLDQQQQLLRANDPRNAADQTGKAFLKGFGVGGNVSGFGQDNAKEDKLLPFWEQLDAEQAKMDAELNSMLGSSMSSGQGDGVNLLSGAAAMHASHLLSHYETTDKDTPLGEIVPLQTLQHQEYKKQEEKRFSQLRHLTKQQEMKQQRQDEWLEVVRKHVDSGNANVVIDEIDATFHGGDELFQTISQQLHPTSDSQLQDGDNSEKDQTPVPINSTTQTQSSHSSFTKFLTVAPPPALDPNSTSVVPKKVEPQTIPLQFTIESTTVTSQVKQERVYAESSAYIVRHYLHRTTTSTTPQLQLLAHVPDEFLNEIPHEHKQTKSNTSTTHSTVVSRLLRICDVTGGFGTDSFILASSVNTGKDLEVEVNMVEGDKILFTMLCDGVRRAQQVHQYSDLKPPKVLSTKRKSRKNRHLVGEQGASGSSIGGFGYDNIYSDGDDSEAGSDDLEKNEDEEYFDSLDYTKHENTPEESKEVVQSLKRDRYFPHSKVTLPNIHGMDLNDPAVQKKLSKKGRFGQSQADLHFEASLKQQQRIVELAEKSLKQYIEGGLGDDQDSVDQQGIGGADAKAKNIANLSSGGVNMTLSSSFKTPTPQAAPSSNPALRNKVLSQQHLYEVGLIAKRMNVVYGNSLEFLTRSHFRVPASLYQSTTSPAQTTVQQYKSYKKRFETTTIFDVLGKQIASALKLPALPSLSPSVPKLISLSGPGKGHENDETVTTLKSTHKFNANPHFSPVFSAHYPYPTYSSSTSLQIHRPYDVVYMDPFYPVKNRGRRSKVKMLQRNSKFMSFAKQLQDIYLLQEPHYMQSKFKTNVLLSKLVEIHLVKSGLEEMQHSLPTSPDSIGSPSASSSPSSFDLLRQSQQPTSHLQKQLQLSRRTHGSSSALDSTDKDLIPAERVGKFGYDDMNDVFNHLAEITAKVSLYQAVSTDLAESYEQSSLNDIDPEQGKPKVAKESLTYFAKKSSITPLPLLTTSAQYELYGGFMNMIYAVYADAATPLLSPKALPVTTKLSTALSTASKLTTIYSILYTTYPAALPLYLHALSATTHAFISPLTKSPSTQTSAPTSVGSSSHPLASFAPTHPFNTLPSSHSLILTREPENTHLLFDAARISANRRVVLKRPIYAPIIHKQQTVCIHDNKTRFDVVTPLASHSYTNRVLHSILNRVRSRYTGQYHYSPVDLLTNAIGDSAPSGSVSAGTSSPVQEQFYMLHGSKTGNKSGPSSPFVPGLASNAAEGESVLCYDNSSQHGVYSSKLAKKHNLHESLTHTHLRSPVQPYLAFTSFATGTGDGGASADGPDGDGSGDRASSQWDNEHEDETPSAHLVNRQKQIKAQKQRDEDKARSQLRKAKRKGKKK